MNVKLLKPVEIRGEVEPEGKVVSVSKPQGEWLIAREAAAKTTAKPDEEASS